MATKQMGSITLPALRLNILKLLLVGDTPLIVHNWSKKSKEEMLGKQMKKAKTARDAKSPEDDFKASLYIMEDGRFGFPSVGFKSAAVTACTSVGGITKVAARQAFHVAGERSMVDGAWSGIKMSQDLVEIKGDPPAMREDMVRVGMGTADIRYRAEFWPWTAVLKVRHNANVLSPEQITNLFNTAGFGVGVGEWRSEKDGQYGLFHVATEADLKQAAP